MVLDGFSRQEAARLCGMDSRRCGTGFIATTRLAGMGLPTGRVVACPASLSWVGPGEVVNWVEQGAEPAREGVVQL